MPGRLHRLDANTPYTYTVDAFDTAGNVGPPSAPLVATAPDRPAAVHADGV